MRKLFRIYYSNFLQLNQEIVLSEEANYLINVLRLKQFDVFKIFNDNKEYRAQIITVNKKNVIVKLVEEIGENSVLEKQVKLIFSPIKVQRLEWLCEKATELGVTIFQPVLTEHTYSKNMNNERLMRIIKESVEQSERLSMPVIAPTIPLKKVIDECSDNSVIWANENHNSANSAKNLSYYNNKIDSLLIGPEGGFSKTEQEFLQNHQAVISISLGNNILRSETAAIVGLSYIKLIDSIMDKTSD